MLNKKNTLVAAGLIVLMLVVGGLAFAAGAAYGNTQAQNIRAEFFQNRPAQGQGGAQGQFAQGQSGQQRQGQPGQSDQADQSGRGGQLAQGQAQGPGQFGRIAATGIVKSVQGNKIELTMQNGNTVTVMVDTQTQINKTTSGSISDIQTGSRIIVMSDQTGNNVTARSISIQPQQTSQ